MNENENVVQEAREVFEAAEILPALYGETLPEISEQVLDELIETAKDVVTWVKPRGNGFVIDDVSLPVITGNITHINAYLVKWENDTPHKIEYVVDETKWPEDYAARCDVVISTERGDKLGISSAQTSFKKYFCPYIKMLTDKKLKPNEVITEFGTWEAKGQLGTFNIVKPRLIDDIPF